MISEKENTKRIKKIRNLIAEKGINNYFLAGEINITPQYLSMILTKQKPVCDTIFERITNYFKS
jgi:hypothetical protein